MLIRPVISLISRSGSERPRRYRSRAFLPPSYTLFRLAIRPSFAHSRHCLVHPPAGIAIRRDRGAGCLAQSPAGLGSARMLRVPHVSSLRPGMMIELELVATGLSVGFPCRIVAFAQWRHGRGQTCSYCSGQAHHARQPLPGVPYALCCCISRLRGS